MFAVLTFSCSNSDNTDANTDADDNNPVYLDANGVTVKAKDWAAIGQSGKVNGVDYTIVDLNTLKSMIEDNQDVSKVCTSKIEYMSFLFKDKGQFNQDVGSAAITTPNMDFSREWTDEELFKEVGFTDEEIAEVYRIIPSYY